MIQLSRYVLNVGKIDNVKGEFFATVTAWIHSEKFVLRKTRLYRDTSTCSQLESSFDTRFVRHSQTMAQFNFTAPIIKWNPNRAASVTTSHMLQLNA